MKVGSACTFYHEGGRGDKRWVVGWRYGVIRSIPVKGAHKNWMHIEVQVRRWTWDDAVKKWKPRPFDRVWVHRDCVNYPGDYTFHGERLVEAVEARKELKAKQQAKADKKKPTPKR